MATVNATDLIDFGSGERLPVGDDRQDFECRTAHAEWLHREELLNKFDIGDFGAEMDARAGLASELKSVVGVLVALFQILKGLAQIVLRWAFLAKHIFEAAHIHRSVAGENNCLDRGFESFLFHRSFPQN